ncbi:hydroxymethylglutaryl-CoA lyase [Pseudarcicella hirudinis]|uniref:Hydroxymethylglutaryl-CoA lyase n=1 Tax=Pseudarcicella hirudinis TaxID=1079859 RepID=A0A1I5QLR0_9BACT|nr:hydroxymethylglutaryl-CoA lyase [Pseudarcicella hirudinis]SFP47037.1 hydroxymethylglutaryl-CoA lyase [Pseudarcicella hirudinis]
MNQVKIIECPRDAMQGWENQIPTEKKITYLNQLLKVGFDTLDFGSFVSPKAIPQLADTAQVYEKLDLDGTPTKLLAIIANLRGAETALSFEKITYLGFPFSISETFQQRNTNSSIAEAYSLVEKVQNLCQKANKQLVIYFSMGFGNPYRDPYDVEIVANWAEKMANLGIKTIALSDTVGVAETKTISELFSELIPKYPSIEFGGHFHATPDGWRTKIEAAYEAGCRRFDGAIGGFGGCPMAEDELVGNIDTTNLFQFFREKGENTGIDKDRLIDCVKTSTDIFI